MDGGFLEFLIEGIFSFIEDGFLTFFELIIPKRKFDRKKYKRIVRLVFGLASFVLLAALLVGIIILNEAYCRNFWGWLLVSLNILYWIVGITFKIIACAKRRKQAQKRRSAG